MRPLLYTYRRCPYAMRARMALLAAGVAFDAREIVLRDKPAEMLALSPKGTVPVLVLPTGEVLEQSWDIMAWAWSAHDALGWWAGAQTPQNLQLLATNDADFKHHLDRYKYPERFGGTDREGHRAQAVATLLIPLDARLREADFLGGDAPCATDLAVFPFVRQFAMVDPTWWERVDLPALKPWLAAWLSHPLFAACMAKLPARQRVVFPPLMAEV
ncbi:glutathione S-transferase [Hydrogenophaga sp. OTU3427]|uniref:glutathione S-transferase n=1 Tax=Hydrogenophaga sp. OTU3427 TaxID=3043856 RepID=UPI00313D3DDE